MTRKQHRLIPLATLLALSACSPAGHEADAEMPTAAERTHPAAAAAHESPPTSADSMRERARMEEEAGSLRATFERVPVLRPREVAELRMDVNRTQIASARRLGIRVSSAAHRDRLLRSGSLVELEDSTEFWILRRMEHSAAHATPDTRAMLEALGRRFHERLDSLGLPRYRMRITSVLRTDAEQASLRRSNPNASRIVSAHEFGTTVDVSHERFAVPAAPWVAHGDPRLAGLQVEMLEEVGREHSRVLQAELGRAIWEMRQDGALHVMMENAQPVYHMTVARRLAEEAE
jgi:hypothetical protein